jgi:RNA polymerase sigma-70 factor, ECF subfamily
MNPTLDQQLHAMRSDLLRFARLQLRDSASAEDVVQETLIAALAGSERFASRSSLKTWVFSILRNKIIDVIRSRLREVPLSELADDEEGDEGLAEALFDRGGHWRPEAQPGRWCDPEDSFEQQQFWAVFEVCLDQLPEKTARVFSLRELLGFETDEICKETGISATNCWVVLHRARQALRVCLEQRWFMGVRA